MTESAGPLTTQIAASIEEVKALLDDNRSLSIACLARRIRDHEDEVRKRFREINHPEHEAAMMSAQAAITKLEQRLDAAAMKFKELREEVDQLKGEAAKAKGGRDG